MSEVHLDVSEEDKIQGNQVQELGRTADDLAGPPPLERLPAHRVAVCPMFVHHATARQLDMDTKPGYRVFLEPRIDAAHRRLIQATKTLATVRKLGMGSPVVPVNVIQTVTLETKGEETPRLDVPTLMICSPRR